jgi:hypothetical protein
MFFPSGFLSKIVYAFLIYPMPTSQTTHLVLLDFLIIFREGYTPILHTAPHYAVF